MPNQMIALQARAPKAFDLGAMASQYGNAMANMAKMDEVRRSRTEAQSIRDIIGDPTFNSADPASLNRLIGIGPTGVAAAQQLMQAQKIGGEIEGQNLDLTAKRTEQLGAGIISILRDPSDATLGQVAQSFQSVGMKPAEYEGVLGQIAKIADPEQRKQFVLEFVSQAPKARDALKFVAPDIKAETVGDAHIFIDNNANSPTFGKELFRFSAAPEPVKLNQQVVENTLYNVNPITGVAEEAPVGDATANLAQPQRAVTRTDTGVASPYTMGGGAPATAAPPADFAVPAATQPMSSVPRPAAGGNAPAPRGGNLPSGAALTVDVLRPIFVAQESGGDYTAVSPKGAMGAYQVMPATAQTLAKRVGLPWRPDLMTSSSVEGKRYQDAVGGAALQEAIRAGGGDLATTAMYYHGGSNRNIWGPKTRRYAQEIAARFSGGGGGGNAPASAPAAAPAQPMTVAEANRRKSFAQILPIIGYNPQTGADLVSALIPKSTSGTVETMGANLMGAVTGKATPGSVAIGQLRAIADNMTFEKLRGKLGAQISDADVNLIANTMGDIADPTTPANKRLASWQNVVLPLLLRGAGVTPPAKPPRGGGGQGGGNIPTLTPDQVRANPKIKRWRTTDGRVMTR